MKKLLLFSILTSLLLSCEKPRKTYYYIEIIDKKELMNDIYHRVQKEDTLFCVDDTIASELAYEYFYLQKKTDKDYKEKGIENFDTIVDFKLLNKERKPIDINKILSKEKILAIEKKRFSESNQFDNLKSNNSNPEDQFSKWDGSHKKLTEYIKSQMNNPDSYEHVSTKAATKSSHILVVATIRGENAYGATITTTYEAKVDKDTGDVISVKQQ